jgi:hypothetical protein
MQHVLATVHLLPIGIRFTPSAVANHFSLSRSDDGPTLHVDCEKHRVSFLDRHEVMGFRSVSR